MTEGHVVVTGANGFIGRHVCSKLIEAGRTVTACVREGADDSTLDNCLGAMKLCRFLPGQEARLAKVFDQANAVIHLAGRAHVMHETVSDPLAEFRKVNVRFTSNLASLAVRSGVKRFIYLSSIKVNGEATEGRPFLADDPPGYCDPYGQSKWEAEEALQDTAAGSGMEWVIVRPPLVYGPHVGGNFLALMKHVFRRTPLPIGRLRNSRSLVSVYNLSDLLGVLVDHPNAANQRFLVSDAEDISTLGLVRQLATAMHRDSWLLPLPESFLKMLGSALGKRSAAQRLCSSLVLDRRKTAETLGWKAPEPFERSLRRTAEWFLSSAAALRLARRGKPREES